MSAVPKQVISVPRLAFIQNACITARVGDELDFAIGEEVTEEQVKDLAFAVNRARLMGSVWLTILPPSDLAHDPLAVNTTYIHVRVSK